MVIGCWDDVEWLIGCWDDELEGVNTEPFMLWD